GFTLIELLVVTVLVGVSIVVLVNLFIGQNRIYRTQTAELNVANDARASLDDIDAYARQARQILANYQTWTTGTQTLVLEIQSINSSNQLIIGAYDTMVYYLTGSNFYRQTFPNAQSSRTAQTKRLASNVTGLSLTYNNADPTLASQVTTDLTIQESVGFQTRSITASSKSYLRNY
ncbi:MAG: hypothetical protein HY545_02060, partial [Candidatus Doudnabacteria bacterium]|nr:hypothetical protein [Candidatus Doudnabacteria bacterium]